MERLWLKCATVSRLMRFLVQLRSRRSCDMDKLLAAIIFSAVFVGVPLVVTRLFTVLNVELWSCTS